MEEITFGAFIASVLAATWRLATPLVYASIGEVFTERSGVLNIGLEGVMLTGSFAGFAAVYHLGNVWVGLLAAIGSGLLLGLLFAFFTVTIKANQIVVGAALNLVGMGLTGFLYRTFFAGKPQGAETFGPIRFPVLGDIPFVGEILFSHNLMVYGTLVAAPLGAYVLYKTAFGLSIRAVGEHPRAADTAGISVARYRYYGVLIGTSLTALGGAYLTLAHMNQFLEALTSGRGFIALAVVVFGRWSPKGAFFASLLFGFFYALQLRFQAMPDLAVPYQFFQAMPYIVTVLVLVSVRGRTAMPKALGVPYHGE